MTPMTGALFQPSYDAIKNKKKEPPASSVLTTHDFWLGEPFARPTVAWRCHRVSAQDGTCGTFVGC